MSRIKIRKVSITEAGTDAIVNAANSYLKQGWGVCGAIFNAAGSRELAAACDAIGHCATGDAVITSGFKLCRYIIHAVGPKWDEDNEPLVRKQLYSAYTAALRLAVKNGCRSIAFPLISAGIFGVPIGTAWDKALQACRDFSGDIDIVFAIVDDKILKQGMDRLSMIIFHDPDKEYGYLSNWYMSDFFTDGKWFNCVEQYIMYRKAKLFGDEASATAILATDDPDIMKKCGRNVKPYDDNMWSRYRQIILYRALRCKFSQNAGLLKQLLDTEDRILAEGTEDDSIFANGMSRYDDKRFDMKAWPGQNLLGFTLMEVREELRH